MKYLNAADYVVFSVVLAFSAAIGVYYAFAGGKQKTASEFLMANRQMGVLPVSLSLLASFMSAITILGTPSELYFYGTQYAWIGLSYVIVMAVSGHVLLPVFYKLQVTSAYEYLERRFHRYVRLIASLTITLQMSVYMGIVLYAPALALNAVTGLNWVLSVLILGAVCTFYTTIGGMKAVMWTDVFQIVVMFGGMLAIVIRGLVEVGGFKNVWAAAERGERIEFLNIDPNPLTRHTVWSLTFGGSITWLVIYGVNQSQVQRYLSTNTMKKAQIALWLNLPGLVGLMGLCGFAGLVAYAYYETCDPLKTKQIEKPDQILPLFVMDLLSPLYGFPGLFIAVVFSGAMSTVSSGVNSLAAIVLEDIIKPYCLCCGRFKDKPFSEENGARVSKILALFFGFLAIALAFLASFMGNVLQAALGLFGMVGGPILGIFLMGMLFPCANWKGAIAGQIFGLVMSLWVGFGGYIYKYPVPMAPSRLDGCDPNITLGLSRIMFSNGTTEEFRYEGLAIYRLSYMWHGMFAVLCTLIMGLLVSFLTGRTKPEDIDRDLLSPVFYICCSRLPRPVKSFLQSGIKSKEKPEKSLATSISQIRLKDASTFQLEIPMNDSACKPYHSKKDTNDNNSVSKETNADRNRGATNLAYASSCSVIVNNDVD